MSTVSNFISGVDDFAGGIINSNLGQTALQIYQQRTQAEIAREQARAQAEIERQRAAAAAAAAKAASQSSTTTGGGGSGFDPKFVLYGAAGVLGLGVIIWAATRK